MLDWPKRCKLAHACLWGYSYKRLKLAQLLGQLGVCLTQEEVMQAAQGAAKAANARADATAREPGAKLVREDLLGRDT